MRRFSDSGVVELGEGIASGKSGREAANRIVRLIGCSDDESTMVVS